MPWSLWADAMYNPTYAVGMLQELMRLMPSHMQPYIVTNTFFWTVLLSCLLYVVCKLMRNFKIDNNIVFIILNIFKPC